jgi:hypothetical protein
MRPQKIILFELNEVPKKILDYFIQSRPQSWLARTTNSRKYFDTYMPNVGHLSPWNTWPSFHRGVPNDKHFLSDFNQDTKEVDAEFPPIWKVLAQEGARVGVFGSLHSFPVPGNLKNVAFHVPDVFAPASDCIPEEVSIFQEINLALSRESSRNVNGRIPVREASKLAMSFRQLGFRLSTVTDIVGQLISERHDNWKTTRRRTYQSVIGFDVFFKQLCKSKPDFVTFFTNHVASSMHRYWAASFPEDYENFKFPRDWVDTYEDEVLWTMQKADDMLERLGRFVDQNPEYMLVCASSMGQEAVECEPTETQLYVSDSKKFLSNLGVGAEDCEILPAMVPQFNYRVHNGADEFEATLERTSINGNALQFRRAESGFFSIDLGQRNLPTVNLEVVGKAIAYEDSGLNNTVIEDMSSASAYHIPQGHLWTYHPSFDVKPLGQRTVEISALDFFQAAQSTILRGEGSFLSDMSS